MNQKNSVLKVENLCKKFNKEAGFFAPIGDLVTAVDGVDFSLGKGETYGLVGESGCGKTTTARLLVRMYPATSGRILYHGNGDKDEEIDVGALGKKDLKLYRERVKYIFQDPGRSLNPRMTVKEILLSGLRYSKKWPGEKKAGELASTLLEETGFSSGDLNRKPGDFSGGQRQRIAIARALVLNPEFVLADEPVSALDVSIQAQILNLLKDLKENFDLTFLLITHDMSVIKYLADRVAIMYLGEIVEIGTVNEIFNNPKHPYTKALLSAVPQINNRQKEKIILQGDLPSPANLPAGCKVHTRCPEVMLKCKEESPETFKIDNKHCVKCFLYN